LPLATVVYYRGEIIWVSYYQTQRSAPSAYLESLCERRVFPSPEARERLAELDFDFPDGPTSPVQVLATLDDIDSPAVDILV
jgi:hypothetical protein